MVKLVDTLASGASARKGVEVQVLFWAPFIYASYFINTVNILYFNGLDDLFSLDFFISCCFVLFSPILDGNLRQNHGRKYGHLQKKTNGKWQAQVRCQGSRRASTFNTKLEAQAWAAETEIGLGARSQEKLFCGTTPPSFNPMACPLKSTMQSFMSISKLPTL